MKKHILFVLIALPLGLMAQINKVYFDYSANAFEGNMPLPAEENFQISGIIDKSIDLVTIEVFNNIERKRSSLYTSTWKRGQDELAGTFTIPMYRKLRGSENYDFQVTYFRSVTEKEYEYTKNQIKEQIEIYLENVIDPTKNKLNWNKAISVIMGDLNNIVNDGLINFTNSKAKSFQGFSDNLEYSLKRKEGINIRATKNDTTENNQLIVNENLENIVTQAINEVDQYIHYDLYYAFDQREIIQYPTEQVKNTVALNVGYGGVWFRGGSKNFQYDHGPYAGVSIPFGKEAFAKSFWNNLSLSTGVFLTNFEDDDGNKVSGPIVQRPFYLGLGYKFFKFLKLQAGAVLLETSLEDDDGFVNFDQISLRPYVGLGVELNFWMGIGK